MTYKSVFQRYEYKYILTKEQAAFMKMAISSGMHIDEYGPTTIRNIYFDTDDFRLIRTSLDKPAYKEKLRLRSYRYAAKDDLIFAELKKKYKGIVFKRRTETTYFEVMDWLLALGDAPRDEQIMKEITCFRDHYKDLKPKAFLTYEREAYVAEDDPSLRITFDRNILARNREISFSSGIYGEQILPRDQVLMEIKFAGAMPFRLVRLLSENDLHRSSFSKYGEYYRNYLKDETDDDMKGALLYA